MECGNIETAWHSFLSTVTTTFVAIVGSFGFVSLLQQTLMQTVVRSIAGELK